MNREPYNEHQMIISKREYKDMHIKMQQLQQENRELKKDGVTIVEQTDFYMGTGEFRTRIRDEYKQTVVYTNDEDIKLLAEVQTRLSSQLEQEIKEQERIRDKYEAEIHQIRMNWHHKLSKLRNLSYWKFKDFKKYGNYE